MTSNDFDPVYTGLESTEPTTSDLISIFSGILSSMFFYQSCKYFSSIFNDRIFSLQMYETNPNLFNCKMF